jgi:hypothetical protein
MAHKSPPSPTSDDPTMLFNATTARVGANGAELAVHNGAPAEIRNANSHMRSEAPAI